MNAEIPNDIGWRIFELRKVHLNLTQRQFGDMLGVSASYISKLEKGDEVPSIVLRKLICAKFDVREDWLLNGNEPVFDSLEDIVLELLLRFGPERIVGIVQKISSGHSDVANIGMMLTRLDGNSLQDKEFAGWLNVLMEAWVKGDTNMRGWIIVQLRRAFADLKEAARGDRPGADLPQAADKS